MWTSVEQCTIAIFHWYTSRVLLIADRKQNRIKKLQLKKKIARILCQT